MTQDRLTGADFRARREALGITQEQLAVVTGVSLRALANYEGGHSEAPRDDAYWRLIDALEKLERGESLTMTITPTQRGAGK